MTGESMTIQDYCKEHRCWVARDDEWYEFEERPEYIMAPKIGYKIWSSNGMNNPLDEENLIFPDVPAEKSLIAPDGRLILMEPKKSKKAPKQIQVGEWCKIELIDDKLQKMFLLDVSKPHRCSDIFIGRGILQRVALFDDKYVILLETVQRFTKVAPPKAYTPKKYDTVFAGNDAFDERTPPAIETYWGDPKFITIPKMNAVFPHGRYLKLAGKSKSEERNFMLENGWYYNHILPFDASLVGVPIKDLPKEA